MKEKVYRVIRGRQAAGRQPGGTATTLGHKVSQGHFCGASSWGVQTGFSATVEELQV